MVDNSRNHPNCLIVEDELADPLTIVLKGFSEVGLPNIFQFLFLGNEVQVNDVKLELNGAANVFQPVDLVDLLREDGSALSRYLGRQIQPNDLVVVDWKLNEIYGNCPNGAEALWDAVSSHAPTQLREAIRKTVRTVIITQFPKELAENLPHIMDLARFFKHKPKYIEKTGPWVSLLQTVIDEWRIENGLFGKGPGPSTLWESPPST